MPHARPRPRPVVALGVALSLAGALLLAGCTGGGLSAHAGTPFTACLRASGVDVSEMGSWTRERERAALTDARAMGCVLSDLPRADRRDVLGWAFPELPADAAAEAQAPVAEAVAAYLAARDPGDQDAIAGAGELLVALGMTGEEPAAVRHAVALQPHMDAAGPLYAAWREAQGIEDDPAARARFVEEHLEVGGALGEFFSRTSDALLEAQRAAAD